MTMLVTWLTRILKRPARPPLRRPDEVLPDAGATVQRHEMMTTGEGSRLLLRQGHLHAVLPIEAQGKHNDDAG